MIEAVESGLYDFITFHDLSRAGRSTIDVLTTLSFFQSKGVIVKIDNLGLESIVNGKINPIFNLITTVLSEINSLERTTLLERQAEGILQARLRGAYVGRIKGTTDSTEVILAKHKKVVKELKTNPHLSLRKIVTLKGVSANTVKKVASILQNLN